jgi:ATP-dependent helicase/nuclease subunit A
MGKKDPRKIGFEGMSKYIDCIPSTMPVEEYDREKLMLLNELNGVRKVIVDDGNAEKTAKMRKNFEYVYPFLGETSMPLKYTVTAVNVEESKDYQATHVLFDDEYTTDAERGTIAHKFLELYDFYSNDDCLLQAEKMIERGLITREEIDKIDLKRIQNALNGGAFDGIKNYALYREKSFLVSIEGEKVCNFSTHEKVLLQGVIDLLAVSDNSAQIIDYKYSSLDSESLKNKYKKQLELYAYAVESVLGLKVAKKALVNLFTGQTVIL